jgi:hypothetical protein
MGRDAPKGWTWGGNAALGVGCVLLSVVGCCCWLLLLLLLLLTTAVHRFVARLQGPGAPYAPAPLPLLVRVVERPSPGVVTTLDGSKLHATEYVVRSDPCEVLLVNG